MIATLDHIWFRLRMPAAFNQKSFSSVVSQFFLFIAPFHLVPFHTLHTHTQALHGEQYVEIKQPLPTSGNVLNVPSLLYLCPVPSSYIIALCPRPILLSCMLVLYLHPICGTTACTDHQPLFSLCQVHSTLRVKWWMWWTRSLELWSLLMVGVRP